MNRSDRADIVVSEIWKWYKRHKRTLPWRDLAIEDDTERAYQVLVSEIMLQQTQVSRVKIVFKDFLSRFPKINDLASASNKDVILAWRGMGYNNRALRLRDAARAVVNNSEFRMQNSEFPKEMTDLQKLPGVGHYTAAAIRNFAFNVPTPCLDTNIRRIIHRAFYGPERADGTWPTSDTELLHVAELLLHRALHHGDARNWHAALMDFGSLVCTKRSPKWDVCPLTEKGVMKAAHKVPVFESKQKKIRKEPGRFVGSTYIPNRIFRGKVIEELRDAPTGLPLRTIGRRICLDWNDDDHTEWLKGIIQGLTRDKLIRSQRNRIVLAQ